MEYRRGAGSLESSVQKQVEETRRCWTSVDLDFSILDEPAIGIPKSLDTEKSVGHFSDKTDQSTTEVTDFSRSFFGQNWSIDVGSNWRFFDAFCCISSGLTWNLISGFNRVNYRQRRLVAGYIHICPCDPWGCSGSWPVIRNGQPGYWERLLRGCLWHSRHHRWFGLRRVVVPTWTGRGRTTPASGIEWATSRWNADQPGASVSVSVAIHSSSAITFRLGCWPATPVKPSFIIRSLINSPEGAGAAREAPQPLEGTPHCQAFDVEGSEPEDETKKKRDLPWIITTTSELVGQWGQSTSCWVPCATFVATFVILVILACGSHPGVIRPDLVFACIVKKTMAWQFVSCFTHGARTVTTSDITRLFARLIPDTSGIITSCFLRIWDFWRARTNWDLS